MKVIDHAVRMLVKPQPYDHDDVLRYIEEIGRVCYKSEGRITNDSAPKFIKMLKSRKHWAMLEHYTFTISVPFVLYASLQRYLNDRNNCLLYDKARYINIIRIKNGNNSEHYVSGSATAFNYFFESLMLKEADHLQSIKINSNYLKEHLVDISNMIYLNSWLCKKYPELFIQIPGCEPNSVDEDSIRFCSIEEVKAMGNDVRLIHDWLSFRIITNRGVTHEIVRHRPASYAQASTRYCNYSDDKFGNELTFIKPHFYDDDILMKTWSTAMKESESHYMEMLNNGASPQQAREVLPNSLMTEITMTCNLLEWEHFLHLRCDPAAHPEMRIVAEMIREQYETYKKPERTSEELPSENESK